SLLPHPLPGFLEEPGAGRRRFENLGGVDAADLIDRRVIGGGTLCVELPALVCDLRDERGEGGGLRRVAHHRVAVIALADGSGAARRIERAALREGAAARRGQQHHQGEAPRKSAWI